MKRILLVCGGNTCRSPMARVILEEMLRERGLQNEIAVDSAAKGRPTHTAAIDKAREAIKELCGKDLLADHKTKSISETRLDDYHLILTMEENQKQGLPRNKTYTLREYAGLKGNIEDPYGGSLEAYRNCRDEIKNCLKQALERIVQDC